MPFIVKKMTTMARIAIHAPARNLVTSTITSTAPVQQKPIRLVSCERRIRRRAAPSLSVRSSRAQCRSMPACEQVNDTNTPTM